ncbi:MAG TPA: ABC transporter permease [Thermoguttaceae bacterium]|nr:ABC transporter permease [Thermoguttaceae bacterium]
MYKFLLCWRYLRTRWIALASIVSVTLGVSAMIVVNSVMSGFVSEMHNRLHGILSDVVLESRNLNGFPYAERHMEKIRQVAGDRIDAMTPTVTVPAMLAWDTGSQVVSRPVQLIGIDPSTQGDVSAFCDYLQHPENRVHPSFDLRGGGYDVHDHQAGPESPERSQMADAGWPERERWARELAFQRSLEKPKKTPEPQPKDDIPNPFAAAPAEETAHVFDPGKEQYDGVVLGIATVTFPDPNSKDGRLRFLLLPGNDVKLSTINASQRDPKFVTSNFTIVDFYESKMSEYDSQMVFVPLRKLQEMRGMIDPEKNTAYVNSIQIKLRPGVDGAKVRDDLAKAFPSSTYVVSTWQDKQGPLLAAVNMEITILNILLFFIIAVAGFGILAIFLMIVVEKTRDIGILKSLGASRSGVMSIFLGYGLSLGLVGSGAGLVIGLLFVRYINEIADWVGEVTGRPLFDPNIYYFYRIPTIIDPWTIAWIVLGALGIAVLSSVLPALRAATLHPVKALRYE